MGDTAYHMEALRKARVIERKSEAMRRLKEGFGQGGADESGAREMYQAPLVYSEPGHFEQTRLTYYRVGTQRDRLQYDHSRNGPIVDKTNYQLRRDFNFMGDSLCMLKDDIVPAHKPIPVCRRM